MKNEIYIIKSADGEEVFGLVRAESIAKARRWWMTRHAITKATADEVYVNTTHGGQEIQDAVDDYNPSAQELAEDQQELPIPPGGGGLCNTGDNVDPPNAEII